MSQESSRLPSPVTVETSCTAMRHSTSTSMPKLRDSCVACASSKVRCHRQKPSCSRCLKRKIPCEYVTSKRGGRNPAGRTEATTTSKINAKTASETAHKAPKLSTSPIEWFGPSFRGADEAEIPLHITTTSTLPSASSSTTFIDPFLTAGSSTSMEMQGPQSDFDRFIASASSYYSPLEYEKDFNTSMLGDLGDLGNLDAMSLVIDGDYTIPLTDPTLKSEGSITPAVLSSISSPSVSPTASQKIPPAFIDNILHEIQDYEANSFQCGCTLYAVCLMKQLFADQSAGDSALSANRTTASSRVQTTIARNKHAIDVVDSILQCYFPHDEYLTFILSIILLKVLDCYADAAHNRPSSDVGSTFGSGSASPVGRSDSIGNKLGSMEDLRTSRNSSISSSLPLGCSEKGRGSYGPGVESGQSARTSMHLILGELHRPQRVVNQLSDLLKKKTATNSGLGANMANCSSPGRTCSTGGSWNTSPFSDIIWKQLRQDLKRRLRKLSLEIIEALKKE